MLTRGGLLTHWGVSVFPQGRHCLLNQKGLPAGDPRGGFPVDTGGVPSEPEAGGLDFAGLPYAPCLIRAYLLLRHLVTSGSSSSDSLTASRSQHQPDRYPSSVYSFFLAGPPHTASPPAIQGLRVQGN
jgi:hypothetical protein